jgi:hypothetical protein
MRTENDLMFNFTAPIIGLTVPASGVVAAGVEEFVKRRLLEAVPAFADDPSAEVSSTPMSDYTDVMIFLGREDLVEKVESQIPEMRAALKKAGVSVLFYVRKAA